MYPDISKIYPPSSPMNLWVSEISPIFIPRLLESPSKLSVPMAPSPIHPITACRPDASLHRFNLAKNALTLVNVLQGTSDKAKNQFNINFAMDWPHNLLIRLVGYTLHIWFKQEVYPLYNKLIRQTKRQKGGQVENRDCHSKSN